MNEQVQGIRGEYRCLTSAEIGALVRMTRERLGMKRAVLAYEAKLSDKTIERAEAGVGVEKGSYRRIALALGMKQEAFLQPLYVPAPEEAEEMVRRNEEEFKKEYTSVAVEPVRDLRHVMSLFGVYALVCDDSVVADTHLDEVAAFKDNLRDWNDIADEIPQTERLQAARGLLDELRQIEQLGYVAKAGVTTKYRLKGGSVWKLGVLTFFRRPQRPHETPDEVWLPKRMKAF